MKFIGLILNFNLFKFGNGFYIQRSGTAMGTKMAPRYANLFMGFLEKDILEKSPYKPLVWYRYIDDVFFIWTHGRDKLDAFLKLANENANGMVFEVGRDSVSENSVPFLDVRVILQEGKLHSDLYIKPTDKFQYLDFNSCHPYHQKANLPYALALRIRRICSNTTDFKDHCDKLTMRLRSRGYKMGLIKDGIRKASNITRAEALSPSNNEQETKQDRVIFSTTYNPMLPNMKDKLDELQPILQASDRCKEVFKEPPIIAYRRNRSLNDIIVSRRLPPDTVVADKNQTKITIDKSCKTCEICGRSFANGKGKMVHMTLMHKEKDDHKDQPPKPPGFHKCNTSRCNLCVKGVFGTNIRITETNEVFHIKQHITCKSKNLIYCVTCKKCMEQYIGETEQELHSRSVGHLSDIRNDKPGLPYVTHFQKCGIEHYSITGIEKLRNSNRAFRKQRELFYKDYFEVRIK